MPINKLVKQGDCFDSLNTPDSLIVHGCNAQGAFGRGFAGQVRAKNPEALFAYLHAYHNGGLMLGEIYHAKVPHKDNVWLLNGITQEFYGGDRKLYVSYDAIQKVMRNVREFCRVHRIQNINMPKIGADLGGGDWKIIEKIIDEELGVDAWGNPSNSSSLPVDFTYTIWEWKP